MLQIGSGELQTWRAAVDNAADGGRVTLTEGGNTKEPADAVA